MLMESTNLEIQYTTQTALSKATRILLSAFVHLSTNWTNRGFKFQHKATNELKTCVLGAIDHATMQHLSRHVRDDDLSVLIINATAFEHFNASAITVNDDLGYQSVVKLFALAIERAFVDATRISEGIIRVEYRTT